MLTTWYGSDEEMSGKRPSSIFHTGPLINLLKGKSWSTLATEAPKEDTLSTGVGTVLSQQQGTPPVLHPCAIYSHKLTPHKLCINICPRCPVTNAF